MTDRRRLRNAQASGRATTLLKNRLRGVEQPDMARKPIGDIVRGYEPDVTIAQRLGRYTKPNVYREGDYTHVSDLVHKCARMMALAKHFDSQLVTESIRPGTGLTFAIGSAVGDYIVESALRMFRPEEIYAQWACECKKTSVIDTMERAAQHSDCTSCGTALNNHHELVLQDEEHRITGAVDLTLMLNDALYFNELKSIAHNRWEELSGPQPEHVIQVLFYWWLARRNNYRVHQNVSIIYASKQWMMKSPYKEFVIDAENAMPRLEDYLEDALALAPFKRSQGTLEDLPVRTCPTQASPVAKKCPLCTDCFSI